MSFVKLTSKENYDDFMDEIELLLKQVGVEYKWVNGLILYPDNYYNTTETSWYTKVLYLNDDLDLNKSSTYPISIDFNIENVKDYKDLKAVFKVVKENKKTDKLFASLEDIVDFKDDMFDNLHKMKEEYTKKEQNKNAFLEGLSLEQIKELKDYILKVKDTNIKTVSDLFDILTKEEEKKIYSKEILNEEEAMTLLKKFLIEEMNYDEEHAELKIEKLTPEQVKTLTAEIIKEKKGIKLPLEFKNNKEYKKIFDKSKKQQNTMSR